jgi:hypothetical protein
MQNEYEQLIKEAKLIVDESEARHHKLAENAEAEKRAKVHLTLKHVFKCFYLTVFTI